ncbi:hypothetical protein [Micromonospora psammae]|uniref:hypothetical protein n=1 Tax=Micromonospora sp. CPCC 205556 TaxID=3122398 RepID=UPI002FEFF354
MEVAVHAVLGSAAKVAGDSAPTLVQLAAEGVMRGRTMSPMSLSMVGLAPLEYAGGGLIASAFGLTTMFLTGALIQAVAVLTGVTSAALRAATVVSSGPRPA